MIMNASSPTTPLRTTSHSPTTVAADEPSNDSSNGRNSSKKPQHMTNGSRNEDLFYTSRYYSRSQPLFIAYDDDVVMSNTNNHLHEDDDDESSTETTVTTATATSTEDVGVTASARSSVFPRLPEDENTTNLYLKDILTSLEDALRSPDCSKTVLAERWNALGLLRCHTQGSPAIALQCHQRALACMDEAAALSTIDAASTYHDIGFCHERLQHCEEALQSYQNAVQVLDLLAMAGSHPRRLAIERSLSRVMRT